MERIIIIILILSTFTTLWKMGCKINLIDAVFITFALLFFAGLPLSLAEKYEWNKLLAFSVAIVFYLTSASFLLVFKTGLYVKQALRFSLIQIFVMLNTIAIMKGIVAWLTKYQP